ncbi:Esterase [Smittium mucronatum]|uniref:Esterase n=1 Tax=Smittium mucronatum TaxID=133383 RepID=A0A1R0H5I0_9FUNG|nr:Esterase [Smittium mucronatum]
MSDLASGIFRYNWDESQLNKLAEDAKRISGEASTKYFLNGPTLPNWSLGYQIALEMVKLSYSTLRPDYPVTLENFNLQDIIKKNRPFRESVANMSTSCANFRKHEWPIVPSELLQGKSIPLFSKLIEQDNLASHPRTLNAEVVVSDSLSGSIESKYGSKVDAFGLEPLSGDEVVMIHYHGGAYSRGSPSVYRNFFAKLSNKTNLRVIAPSYRLAPDNVYPASIYDGFMFYMYLLNQGFKPENMVLMGDSAGGNLTVVVLQLLKEIGLDQPKGAVLYSPWVDLSHTHEFNSANAPYDFVALPDINNIYNSTRLYIQPGKPLSPEFLESLKSPYISPTYGDLEGLAPLYIQSGNSEVLLDDIDRFAEKTNAQRVKIQGRVHPGFNTDDRNIYETYVGMAHVFFVFEDANETYAAIDGVDSFIKRLN